MRPPEPGIWGTKISGDCLCGLSAQGVTSDLDTCGPVQVGLAQGILDKNFLWMGLTGMVTLAQFGLMTGFLLGPADDRRVSPSPLPRSRFSLWVTCAVNSIVCLNNHPGLQSNV